MRLMNPCRNGLMSTLAQGLCLCHRNPGHLEMNIMMPDAVSLTSCGRLIYEKEKTDHHKLETRNTTIWVRQREL